VTEPDEQAPDRPAQYLRGADATPEVTVAGGPERDAGVEDDVNAARVGRDAHEGDPTIDRLDDGGTALGRAAAQALPFTMSSREHFAALDDVGDTGDARVDAATARLGEIPDLPTSDHVGIYDDVHRRLQDALSDADPH
jgi:hypothetical protein